MTLELEIKDVKLIREGLGKLPFDEVANLIVELQNQISTQIQQEKEKGENNNGNNVQ